MWTLAARRCFAVLLVLSAAGPVRAQVFFRGPPSSTLLDTSIRSAAMGGASAAVTWGEPGVWANPGTLASVNGVGWVAGRTHTDPGFDNNIVFSSQRLLIGGGGLGFSLMGQPISGLGKARLDLPAALPLGGTNDVFDQTEGWGAGLSPLKLYDTVRGLATGSPGRLTSYGDVTFGYQSKKSKAMSGGDVLFEEAGTYDWGVGGRLSIARWWGPDAPFRLDLSGAYSRINVLQSDSKNTGASTVQFDRTGFALHLSPAPPSERGSSPPSLPWWRPGDVPELSMGLAYDRDERHYEPYGSDRSGIDHVGFEANVFRLLALRAGYVYDPHGPKGWSYGGGVTLPIGPWGSVGYQLASVPLVPDLRQFRQGWSVWLDPSRLWSDAR